jgi:hypothetical protein
MHHSMHRPARPAQSSDRDKKRKIQSPNQVAVQVANVLTHADVGVIEQIANQVLKRKVIHIGEDASGEPIFEEIEK